MIKVEISNVKGNDAKCSIEVSGDIEIIYNELVQLFIHLLSNDKTANVLMDSIGKCGVVLHDKNK